MPPNSSDPLYELLTRHGVDHDVAKSNSMSDLRHREPDKISSRRSDESAETRHGTTYSYFRDGSITKSAKKAGSRKWVAKSCAGRAPCTWVSPPPRAMRERSARGETAL